MKTKTAGKKASPSHPKDWVDPLAPKQPLVSGSWLLRAFLLSVLGAAACAYLALCLLFWQGQWQMLFHPSRTVTANPSSVGIHFDDIRFDATETGELQLAGWWIPAEPNAQYAKTTILFLRNGSGSLSDSIPYVSLIHNLGANLFIFDYRGFGQSKAVHPSEAHLQQDAEAALNYLTGIRHLPLTSIIPYGQGLGASVAVDMALEHSALPGVILDNPAPPALQQIQADARTKLLPLRLLFHDRFEISSKLPRLKTPKLFLTDQPEVQAPEGYQNAASPKVVVYLKRPLTHDQNTREAISRFISESMY